MTVEPGFGGQKLMPEMMDKVHVLKKKYPSLDIEYCNTLNHLLKLLWLFLRVHGGLGPSSIDTAASAGANCIIAGSSVFGAPKPAAVISLLRKSMLENQGKS
ncbi:hypothetical protein PTKIN_Ptkin08bG0011700 [Pterospermum kingtungense]